MIESFDPALVNWARAQFALTVYYHFLFVPLTLGLSFILAIMESLYYKTGDVFWKNTTKFWAKLFGINFAIGVATGIIMEFEFGTNWSNYSWFVGDIFGAPLAVEGIFAFFLEATFFAVVFFGWEKVSKKFHLFSTWMVAVGSNLSALWILVANGWMQYPVGTAFNPDMARNEMTSFADVVFSPVAVTKFLHMLGAAYVYSALFVCAVAAWYLLRKRHVIFAKKSIVVASTFGLVASLFVAIIGDQAGFAVAQTQPMKMAAAEGLYKGQKGAGVIVFGFPNFSKKPGDGQEAVYAKVEIPYLFSQLGHRDPNAFVAGIEDLLGDYYPHPTKPGVMLPGVITKMAEGKIALQALKDFHAAKTNHDQMGMDQSRALLDKHGKYLGYGHLSTPEEAVPSVWTVFFSFHLMVALGVYFIILFIFSHLAAKKDQLEQKPKLLKMLVWSWPLGMFAIQLGWAMAEVGRQPWAIEGLMPVKMAVSNLSSGIVMFTFFAFFVVFTALLIAEIKIMTKAISKGPEGV